MIFGYAETYAKGSPLPNVGSGFALQDAFTPTQRPSPYWLHPDLPRAEVRLH